MPPPGRGLTTVIVAVVGVAISAAVSAAVNFALFTNVVGLALPFQLTTEPETKPVPVTVKVNAVLPGGTASGSSGFKYGTWFAAVAKFGATAKKTPTKNMGSNMRRIERFI